MKLLASVLQNLVCEISDGVHHYDVAQMFGDTSRSVNKDSNTTDHNNTKHAYYRLLPQSSNGVGVVSKICNQSKAGSTAL